jgi:hypothetical protein
MTEVANCWRTDGHAFNEIQRNTDGFEVFSSWLAVYVQSKTVQSVQYRTNSPRVGEPFYPYRYRSQLSNKPRNTVVELISRIKAWLLSYPFAKDLMKMN